jgi:hypothetical protein
MRPSKYASAAPWSAFASCASKISASPSGAAGVWMHVRVPPAPGGTHLHASDSRQNIQ